MRNRTKNTPTKRYSHLWDAPKIKSEKSIDASQLDQDIPEEFRETMPNRLDSSANTSQNWSQPEDRGEDLATLRDPFMQQPERDTQIPPELIQQRAYQLYEQRGSSHGDTLADWFEAERQLRRERSS